MNAVRNRSIGGHTGLGLLVLMAAALVAGELNADAKLAPIGPAAAGAVAERPSQPSPLFDGREVPPTSVRGAIRELRIIPANIEQRLDLNWAPDERLIEEYRRTGI